MAWISIQNNFYTTILMYNEENFMSRETLPAYLTPDTEESARNIAKWICNSNICPQQYRGKPDDGFIAIGMGWSLGLSPMQSLQNINVINGSPSVWGDGARSVVISHKDFVDIENWFEGKIEDGTLINYCKITRKGMTPHIASFSMQDAMRAGLIGKDNYKKFLPDMLFRRSSARAYSALFPDALKGLVVEDVANDYVIKDVKEVNINSTDNKILELMKNDDEQEVDKKNDSILDIINRIEKINDLKELDKLGKEIKDTNLSEDQIFQIRETFKIKKQELQNKLNGINAILISTTAIDACKNTLMENK
jgi:hypothetical protein